MYAAAIDSPSAPDHTLMLRIVAGESENEYFWTNDREPTGLPVEIYSYTIAFKTCASRSFNCFSIIASPSFAIISTLSI